MGWGGGVGNVPLLIRGGGGRRRQSHLHEDVLHPGWPGERGEVSRASDCRSDGRRDGSRPAGLRPSLRGCRATAAGGCWS